MIDPAAQLAALIQAQFGAQYRAQTRRRAGEPTGGAPDRVPLKSGTGGDSSNVRGHDLQELVAMRVRALSADDPQRQRKAFRLFLESVLTQALGRERFDDRSFQQLVDNVLDRMNSDAQLRAALHEAGAVLLAEPEFSAAGSQAPASGSTTTRD